MIPTDSTSTFLLLTAVPYTFLIGLFYSQTDGFDNSSRGYALWKTLPVCALAAFVFCRATMIRERERRLHAYALLCGALGDFLIGLSESGIVPSAIVFALGHLCYLATFAHRTKKPSFALIVVVVVYGIVMHHCCVMPQTSGFLTFYALILSSSLVISGSMYLEGTTDQEPGHRENAIRFAGFCLFYISDSLLLLEQADASVPNSAFLVLASYFSAQFALMWSACVASECEHPSFRLDSSSHLLLIREVGRGAMRSFLLFIAVACMSFATINGIQCWQQSVGGERSEKACTVDFCYRKVHKNGNVELGCDLNTCKSENTQIKTTDNATYICCGKDQDLCNSSPLISTSSFAVLPAIFWFVLKLF